MYTDFIGSWGCRVHPKSRTFVRTARRRPMWSKFKPPQIKRKLIIRNFMASNSRTQCCPRRLVWLWPGPRTWTAWHRTTRVRADTPCSLPLQSPYGFQRTAPPVLRTTRPDPFDGTSNRAPVRTYANDPSAPDVNAYANFRPSLPPRRTIDPTNANTDRPPDPIRDREMVSSDDGESDIELPTRTKRTLQGESEEQETGMKRRRSGFIPPQVVSFY